MGFIDKQQGTFCHFSEGLIATGSKNKGTLKTHRSLSGNITKLEYRTKEYEGKPYRAFFITLSDESGNYILEMKVESGYYRAIVKALPNVDLSRPIIISPKMDENRKASAYVLQWNESEGKDKALTHFWTMQNPKDLPPLKTTPHKGGTLYDGTEQEAYLEKYIMTVLAPRLTSAPVASHSEQHAGDDEEHPSFDNDVPDSGDGDIPF